MVIKIRKSNERGSTKIDWLDAKHSFSFGRYHNPDNMNFGKLIVFNDDRVAAGKGFGPHPHENAEVVTLVLEGALAHEDSTGNKGTIAAGEMQRMSTGKGIWHSEMNASETEEVALFQMWLEPKEVGIEPSYEQQPVSYGKNEFKTVVSGVKNDDALYIHQDARFLLGEFEEGTSTKVKRSSESHGLYIMVIEGEVKIGDKVLSARDSAEITDEDIEVTALKQSRVIVINVPL